MTKKEIKNQDEEKESVEKTGSLTFEEIKEQFNIAEKAQKEFRDDKDLSWDSREQLFKGKYKNSEEGTKSIFSTGELSSLAIDSSCRVMAQLPSGRFYNYNGEEGANMAMNLIFEHYVIPNAVTGGNFLLKMRLVNLWSHVFPGVPVFIDWVINEKRQYIGPDMIMIHPRRFRPQPGKIAIEDMDYCFIDTEVSKDWLQSRNTKYWKNIEEVLKNYKEKDAGTGAPTEDQSPDSRNKTKTGITIRHRFTSNGDWFVYDPASDKEMLNEKSWFTEIPIAIKRQFPTLDELWSINSFDRGHTNQKALDTLSRYYLEGVAMSIDPPAVMDPDKVVLSSIIRQPKAKWFVKEGAVNAIKMQDVSPQGLNTFQSAYQILKGNLLSLGASSDTTISKAVDPGFGKTPEALRMQGERQGSRDVWDSSMQEIFCERVYTIMADMIAKKGVKPYAFELLGTSIEKIKEQYPGKEINKFCDGRKMKVNNEIIKGSYRYILDSGTTGMKKDNTGEKLISLLKLYSENAQIKEDLEKAGKKVDFGEAFKRIIIDQGFQDAEKILVDIERPESVEGIGDEGATIERNQSEENLEENYLNNSPELTEEAKQQLTEQQ